MNLLQLVNRAIMESGASGPTATNTTIAGATGELNRFVTWINQAWQDIQNEHDGLWLWMMQDFTFNTIAQQAEYPYVSAPLSLANFGSWDKQTFRIYKTDVGTETYLHYLEYRFFRDQFLIGSLKTSYSYPTVITVSPTKSLILALPPDDTSYVVSGKYQTAPSVLAQDADTPEMPARFHMAIVWKALMMYARYENAPEIYADGKTNYMSMLVKMEQNQLPEIAIDRGFL